jgi:acyl carrier protein
MQMVQRSEVEEIIRSVSSSAKVEDADRAKTLREIGIDSLDLSGILLEIEERFKIKIPDQDIERLETIDKIVAYIDEKKGS